MTLKTLYTVPSSLVNVGFIDILSCFQESTSKNSIANASMAAMQSSW